MKVFVECEFTDEELIRLKRVRCNQQVIFYSNVFDAGGSMLDRRYLERRPQGATWSTLIFPQELPPAKDFRLWRQALCLIAPRGRPQQRFGKFVSKGHKIWDWRYDLENFRLYHVRWTFTLPRLYQDTQGGPTDGPAHVSTSQDRILA